MSTRHLMIWAVLAAAALACGPARPACAGLVGLYTFEGNVNDVSGNGYDATTVNNVSYAPGYEGQAGVFDGSTSFADLPFAISRVFAPSVTIGAWVNAAAITPPPNTRHQILSGDSGGYGRSLTIDSRGFGGGDTGVSSYSAFAGSTGVLPGSAASPFQGWVFVAATYQGAERVVRLQVGDQTFVRTMAGTGGTANPLRIGALPVGAEFFNGQIDNAFVFSGALSASQLKTIRDNGATGIQQVAASLAGPPTSYQAAVQSEPSLISYYTFDNDSVATGQSPRLHVDHRHPRVRSRLRRRQGCDVRRNVTGQLRGGL
jgi:hypothetical protein